MLKNIVFKALFMSLILLLGMILAVRPKISAESPSDQLPSLNINTTTNNFYEFLQILANDAGAGDRFGQSVLLKGDTLVVGVTYDDDLGVDSGSVYIFDRNTGGPNQWGLVTKIYGSTTSTGDQFGSHIDLEGDTLVAGSYYDDPNGETSGSAFIFERNQGGVNNWGEVKHLVSSDNSLQDRFGWRVAISGDTVIVGAYQNDDACPSDVMCNSGAAYIFERNAGGTNNWGEVKKLTASDKARDDNFSWGLDIFQDTVIVGSIGDDDLGSGSGSAYVFERDSGGANNWGEVRKLLPSDGTNGDTFGDGVAIDENTLVISARHNMDSGAAYVFERDWGGPNTWGEVKKLVGHDTAAGDEFGDREPQIHGDWIGIGATGNDAAGLDAGAAYIFERNLGGTENWGELTQLTASDAQPGDAFGFKLDFQGQEIVVGARFHDAQAGADQGAVYFYLDNAAPHAVDDTGAAFTTDEDTPFTTGNVLDNDTDPENNSLSLAAVDTTNLLGLLTSNGDGTFNYDPDGQFEFLASGEQALDTFSYTIADTYGLTATANVTITILGVNDAPALDVVTLNPPEINENNAVTLSGNITDMDLNDAHILTLAWGDGFTDTLNLQTGAYYFLATHSYPDDNPTVTPSDIYTLTVFLSDAFVTVSNTLPLTVNNVAPLLTNLPVFTVDENAIATLTGTLTDPSSQDSFTLVVAWGDGATLTYTYPAGTQSFATSHLYLDDNPSGTPLDTYSITLNLWDDDSGFTAATTNVEVVNLPPLANAGPDLTLEAGSPITLAGSFTDPGPLDTHTIFWDFGDGTNTTGTLTPLHLYTIPNTYTVTLTITDDDSGIGMDTLLVHVTEPAPFTFYLFLPLVKNCTLWWECLQ
ncbi:MAG: cadherin-like domain-containing protein [Anaerolineales bacterium]|nr:cadherin-like domain-containing protein [Anaerolineales bacterium]